MVALLARPFSAMTLSELRQTEKGVLNAQNDRNMSSDETPEATANGTGWKGIVNSGAGNTGNWSNASNWDSMPPASDERYLLFGLAYRNASGINYIANNDLANYIGYRLIFDNITNPVGFTLQGNAITLADFKGSAPKIENHSTAEQTLNFGGDGLTFGGNLAWAEINPVNGGIVFQNSNTIRFSDSVAGIKFFGSRYVVFNGAVLGGSKSFALSGNNIQVQINDVASTGDFYVMNGGSLLVGGLLNLGSSNAVRLGGDFGTTGTQDLTKSATLGLIRPKGGQTFSGTINTVPGNTSGALAIESRNPTNTTNTISSQILLDSDLATKTTAGGTLLFQGGSFDIKDRQLSVSGNAIINETLGSSLAAGGSLVSSGLVTLQSLNNNYTGTDPGQLNPKGTVIGGTLRIYGDGSLGLVPQNAYNNIQFTNFGTLQAVANDIALDIKRNITIASGQARFDPDGHVFTINGAISGAGGVAVGLDIFLSAAGTVKLTNPANTYSGATLIDKGTLEVSKLANSGSSSSIGTGGSLVMSLFGGSRKLRYIGSGDTTDLSIFFGSFGAALDASGTGPVHFTNANTIAGVNDPLTLTLTGSNTNGNTLRISLRDSSPQNSWLSSLVKDGVGQWVLLGTSPYTGPTTVRDGTLTVQNGSGSVGNLTGTSAVIVQTGATLLLTGDSTVSDRINNNAGLTSTNGTLRLNSVPEGTVAASGLGPLTLASNTTSVIDLGSMSLLHFAASGNQTWTGALSIWNWNGNPNGGGLERLLFGLNDSSASLTPTQLNSINFYSDSGTNFLGTARFAGLASGEIIPFPPLAFWRQLQGLPADGSQDLANPSGDGVSNLLKYAFNMAPNAGELANPNVSILGQNGSAGLPFIRMDSSGRLVIDFVRRKATSNPGIAYIVETGNDLASLTPLDLSAATVVSIDGTFERVSVTDPMITPTRFGRVRVTVL